MSKNKYTTVVFQHDSDSLIIEDMLKIFSEENGNYADAKIISASTSNGYMRNTLSFLGKHLLSVLAIAVLILVGVPLILSAALLVITSIGAFDMVFDNWLSFPTPIINLMSLSFEPPAIGSKSLINPLLGVVGWYVFFVWMVFMRFGSSDRCENE